MPGSQVVGVVALRPVARRRTKVIELTTRAGYMIVMISWNRFRAVFVAAPRWPVTVIELGQRTVRVDVVAYGENGASNVVEEFGSRLVLRAAAIGDVACAHEDRVA